MSLAARLTLSSDLVIPTQTFTIVTGWTVAFQDITVWNASNDSRITIPSGISAVLFTLQASYFGVLAGDLELMMRKNGTTWQGDPCTAGRGANGRYNVSTFTNDVVAGDYFEMMLWHNAGGSVGISSAGSHFSCEFLTLSS